MDKDYHAGMGCICSAHDASECGCGVDWTEPEIYQLREELATLKRENEILTKGLMENWHHSRKCEAHNNWKPMHTILPEECICGLGCFMSEGE